MAYNLRGYIVSDSSKWIYDWFGISATSPKDIRNWLDSDDTDRRITINSYGGDVFAASEIFNDIAGKVDIEIVGLAASAASIIAMGGKTVRMAATAEMMIHNVSTYAEGDYRDMEHAAEELRVANESIRAAYKYRMNISDEDLQDMLDNETWMSARQAKEKGFVDEIMNEKKTPKEPQINIKNTFKPAMAFFNAIKMPDVKQFEEMLSAMKEIPEKDDFEAERKALEIEKNRYGGL